MNKSVIFAFVVMALLVCVVALFLVGPRKPIAPVTNSTGASASHPDAVPSTAQSRPVVANNAAPTPGGMSSTGQPGSASLAPARPPATPAPPAPEPDDADNPSEELFLSDDEIAAAIRKNGSVVPVYAGASASHRQDIIDFLMAEEQLRKNLPALLPLENDSALRAYMLERTIPKGYFDDAEAVPMGTDLADGTGEAGGSPDAAGAAAGNPAVDDPEAPASATVDSELQALLDQIPSTPMDADEWLARLDLALMTDDAFGLAWARKARDEGPGEASVQALAASILLNLAQGDPTIADDERRRAQQTLTDSLATAASTGSIDPNQRIRAYFALYFAPQRIEARDFLTKQRALETDPRALQTLNQLLERWDKGGVNSGYAGGHGE